MALLVLHKGWNLQVVADLPFPTILPAKDGSVAYQFDLKKVRRQAGRQDTVKTLFDSGPASAGRLIRDWLEMTSHARDVLERHGVDPAPLVLWRHTRSAPGAHLATVFGVGITNNTRRTFTKTTGLSFDFKKVRKSVLTRGKKQPSLHSRSTFEKAYRRPLRRTVEESASTISNGVYAALSHARDSAATIVADANTPGEETGTMRCRNRHEAPHELPGQLCGLSALACAVCVNGILVKSVHGPSLAATLEVLEEQKSVLPQTAWNDALQESFVVFDGIRTDVFTPDQWAEARRKISDVHRSVARQIVLSRRPHHA